MPPTEKLPEGGVAGSGAGPGSGSGVAAGVTGAWVPGVSRIGNPKIISPRDSVDRGENLCYT